MKNKINGPYRLLALAVLALFVSKIDSHAETRDYIFVPDRSNFIILGTRGADFVLGQSKLSAAGVYKDIMRLSSGKRINTAGDDPAGMAVADTMDSRIRELMQRSRNAADFKNYLRTMESALAADQDIVQKIREIIVRSSGPLYGTEEKEINQVEIQEMLSQIDMNARVSEFNTVKLIPELTARYLGLDSVNAAGDPGLSLGRIDGALERIQILRTRAGVQDAVLTFTIQGLEYYSINLTAAESGIRDQDMAEAVTSLLQNNVKIQTQFGVLFLGK